MAIKRAVMVGLFCSMMAPWAMASTLRTAPQDLSNSEAAGSVAENMNNLGRKLLNHVHDGTDGSTRLPVSVLPGFKIGGFTSSAGTGNQSITGIGFKPRAVILFMEAGDSSAFTAAGGWFTETDQSTFLAIAQTDGGAGADATGGYTVNSNYCIVWVDIYGSLQGQAAYVSMDDDGFTIYWSYSQAKSLTYFAFQ